MTDLKRCPWCGNQPDSRMYQYGPMLWEIRCVGGQPKERHVIAAYGYTEQEAEISWNARITPTNNSKGE